MVVHLRRTACVPTTAFFLTQFERFLFAVHKETSATNTKISLNLADDRVLFWYDALCFCPLSHDCFCTGLSTRVRICVRIAVRFRARFVRKQNRKPIMFLLAIAIFC
jgi:hypothetical protein